MGYCHSPESIKELVNLRHAFARNCIEETLCILKRHFQILKYATGYDCESTAALFNFLYCMHYD